MMLSKTASWTGLTKLQQEIFEARLSPRIDKIDVKEFGSFLLSLISRTHVSAGYPYDEKTVSVTLPELVKELRTYFGFVTPKELEIFFRRGYQGEYGEYFGLNNKTFLQWVKNASVEENRVKAIRAMERAKKDLLPKPKELTPEEKADIVKLGALKKFEHYKLLNVLEDLGNVTYDYLDSLGLIAFTAKVKHEIMEECRAKLLEKSKMEYLESLPGDRLRINDEIEELTRGKSKKLVVASKKEALRRYFESLVELGEELETLINECKPLTATN